MKFNELFLVTIVFGLNCVTHTVFGTHEEDSWKNLDVWSREPEGATPDFQECGVANTKNNNGEEIALMFYKRLIKYLFKSELFQNDKENGVLNRAFIISALPEQLKKLENLSDPRDLDSILSEIFLKARVPTVDDCYSLYGKYATYGRYMGFFVLIWDNLKNLGYFLNTTEVQFMLGVASLISIGWYCRRYKISVITMIICVVVCFGYFHTYLECNRKLEAERLIEMGASVEPPKWYTVFLNIFTSSKKSEREFIKKGSKLNLNFCRPDHVFLMYVNDLFLTQLQFLIEKCCDTMMLFSDTLYFPFNYLASTLMMALIAYIIKLSFKYLLNPRAWIGLWQAREQHNRNLPLDAGTEHRYEDRISGGNLRMLLNALSFHATSNQVTSSNTAATAALLPKTPTVSGVEEILSVLENVSADISLESSVLEERQNCTEKTSQNQIETLENDSKRSEKQPVGSEQQNETDVCVVEDLAALHQQHKCPTKKLINVLDEVKSS